MFLELLAICIGAVGGAIGVLGNTKHRDTGRILPLGWVALTVVLSAAAVATLQNVLKQNELAERKARQERLSYYALIDVYGPLSMLLVDSVNPGSEVSRERVFPPNLALDKYVLMHDNSSLSEGLADLLAEGAENPDGTRTYRFAETWAFMYRRVEAGLKDAIDLYGSHISAEALQHLVELRNHSLFRDAALAPEANSNHPCSGWVDDIAFELSKASLEPRWRARCKTVLTARLRSMTRDTPPAPPFSLKMERYHQELCNIRGYRRPYCAWADPRSSSGVEIPANEPKTR